MANRYKARVVHSKLGTKSLPPLPTVTSGNDELQFKPSEASKPRDKIKCMFEVDWNMVAKDGRGKKDCQRNRVQPKVNINVVLEDEEQQTGQASAGSQRPVVPLILLFLVFYFINSN